MSLSMYLTFSSTSAENLANPATVARQTSSLPLQICGCTAWMHAYEQYPPSHQRGPIVQGKDSPYRSTIFTQLSPNLSANVALYV